VRALLALLLACAPAAAQEPAVAPSTAAALTPGQAAQVKALAADLALLLEHGPAAKPAAGGELAAQAAAFSRQVRAAVGEELLSRLAAEAKARRDAALEAEAKRVLTELRLRLRADYAAGKPYPRDAESLGAPLLELPGHAAAGIKLVSGTKHDKEPASAVTDEGGWLYFADPASANYGMLLINCLHKDAAGLEFGRY
jgi:hypothetical protein